MKNVTLAKLTKGARKGLLSRFRKEERGVITLEIAIALSFLGFGFVGLMSTVTSVDNAHAGEQALNDIVMTVRAMPDIDSRTVNVTRSCGCPLENAYSAQMCTTVTACGDGTAPGRYLDLAMMVKPKVGSSNADVIETFNYNALVRY